MDFLFALWVYMGLEAYTTGHWTLGWIVQHSYGTWNTPEGIL